VIIAHLPSGYILARTTDRHGGPLLWAALAGSVFPDIDMLWFHLVDHGAIHHHRYATHAPAFWVLVAAGTLPFVRQKARAVIAMFLAAVILHLVLDTVAGGIMWLWPWSDHLFALVTVPATQSHWVLSFILHWSFLLELTITATAAAVWLRR
jgi:inner membrane protein